MSYLSKSDYKVAHDCYTKLYYKKKNYPSVNDTDEYLRFLAQGGYMVGKLAQLYYPEGIEITQGKDNDAAIKMTDEYLLNKNITLFEAAILSNIKLIRIDILKKNDKTLQLIEVKSKSYDPEKGIEHRDYKDLLFDVGYQYLVLREKFPGYKIKPYLFMPDKSKTTSIDGLAFLFEVKEDKSNPRFRSYNISIPPESINELVADNLLTLVDVEEAISEYLPEIEVDIEVLLPSLKGEPKKLVIPLTKSCFKCEYSITDQIIRQSGYDECWAAMPKPKFHIKDLTRIGPGSKSIKAMDSLIQENKIGFDDIVGMLGDGSSDQRRRIQIEYTKQNREFVAADLKIELDALRHPLHFIDFETTRVALPYHKGMRPYELVTFQWSCHTIKAPGAEPIHGEWLNLEYEFPNFKFAESLMDHLNKNGGIGTPLMWSQYENTTLREVYIQMLKYGYENPELKRWVETIVRFRDRKKEHPIVANDLCGKEGRFVDLSNLALKYYFHPLMAGKTSIKWVLPAVMSSINSPRIKSWLENFSPEINLYSENEDGIPVDPYKLLPPLEIYEKAEQEAELAEDEFVNEGTGAMRAYEDIMIGLSRGDTSLKKNYDEALRRYCQLDTLAMVIIWEYWRNKI